MVKCLTHEELSDTLELSTCNTSADYHGAYWIYDKTRGFNLAMGAKTERAAFIDALEYYQKRLLQVEKELSLINARVDAFVELVRPEQERNPE